MDLNKGQTSMKDILREIIYRFYTRSIPSLITRSCHFPILEGRATVILGMRRTGKTYRCYQRIKELIDSGISQDRILYLNFEDERLKNFTLPDCQLILDVYYERYPQNRNVLCYFFFDEIQNVKEWELFVRRIIDSEKIQITITGSSSKMLSKEMSSTMRGRSLSMEVLPFSLEEYLRFCGIFEKTPDYISSVEKSQIMNCLNSYFIWGGIPEIQKMHEIDRENALQDHYNLVVSRDVKERYKIANIEAVDEIANFIFNSIAERISISGILKYLEERRIKTDWSTIKKYITYLCDAYIFFPVHMEERSLARQKRNPVKYYAIDIGLIRAMSINPTGDNGHLLENLVFIHLHRLGYQMTYVQSQKTGREIDFYAYHPATKAKKLIQVSLKLNNPSTLAREVEAFKSAGEYLNTDEKLIVTWDEEGKLDNDIKVIPAWKFFLDYKTE